MRGIIAWMMAGIAGLAIGTALAHSAVAQDARPVRQRALFRVFASDAKTLLFVGEYNVERSGGRIAESQRYLTPDGKLVKLDESVYDAEHRRPVSFYSANYLSGNAFRVAVSGERLTWQAEDAGGAIKDHATDSLPDGTFMWPNLVNLLSQEWDEIASGRTLAVDLYVVSRKLRIGLDLKAEGTVEVSGIAGLKVKAEPTAWMMRQMASPAWMTLSVAQPHRFLMFQGAGAIQDADGKNIDTVIVFDWSQPK
jgi:hypothetical protein